MSLKTLSTVFLIGGAACAAGFYTGRVTAPEKIVKSEIPVEKSGSEIPANTEKEEVSEYGTIEDSALSVSMKGVLSQRDPARKRYEFFAMVKNMTIEQIPNVLHLLESDPALKGNPEFFSMVISRWVELEPLKAVEYAKKISGKVGSSEGNHVLRDALASWAAKDPEAAMKWMDENVTGWTRTDTVAEMVKVISETDPEKALKLMETQKTRATNDRSIYNIFKNWAVLNLAAAKAKALTMTSPQERRDALAAIGETIAQENPQAALAWLDQLPEGREKNEVRSRALARWVEIDPEAGWAYIQKLPPSEKAFAMTESLRRLMKNDMSTALKFLDGMKANKLKDTLLRSITKEWAQTDFMKAAEYASQVRGGRPQQLAVWEVMQHIPLSRLGDTAEWIEKLPDGRAKNSGLWALGQRWAGEDPKEAAEFLLELPASQRNVLPRVIEQWVKNDMDAAMQWASSVTDKEAQAVAFNQILPVLARQDRDKAIEYVEKIKDPDGQANIAGRIAYEWAASDPGAAMEWAEKLSAEAKSRAQASVIQAWAIKQPNEAAAWLEKMPEGEGRDAAVNVFARQISGKDPEGAVLWAQTISDDDQRQVSVSNYTWNWFRQEPQAMLQWMENSDLVSEEQKANFRLTYKQQQKKK